MIETATVTSTGEVVRVIRRTGSIAQDIAFMTALEAAGCFVIGTPQAFRYKRPGKPKFATPGPSDVLLVDDDGSMTAVLPSSYFYRFHRIERTDA